MLDFLINRPGKILSLLSLLFLTTTSLLAQQPSNVFKIRGEVAEFGTYNPIVDLPMRINKIGSFITDRLGSFQITMPYPSEAVKVEIERPGFEILYPEDGAKVLSELMKPNTTVELKMLVLISEPDESTKRQLKEAQDLVKKIRRKNQVTARQLEELNQALIDTVQASMRMRNEYENKVTKLTSDLTASDELTEIQDKQIEELKERISNLEEQNSILLVRISEALEKKYLEKKGQMDEISENLNTYISRLKDFRDHLKRTEYAFKNAGVRDQLYNAMRLYGDYYEKVDRKKTNHANAISHYWASAWLSSEYDAISRLILSDIHQKEILPLNESVFQPFLDASSGKRHQPKKSVKAANEAIKRINDKIALLEPKLENFVIVLADF